jgi:predicted nucleotidyltransferase
VWVEAARLAREERRRQLEAEMERLLPILRSMGVQRVIVFGSFARGEVRAGSDLDVLVVHDDRRRFLDRLDAFYRRLQPRVALDLLVYTPEELEQMAQTSLTVRSALLEGKVLYEAAGSG